MLLANDSLVRLKSTILCNILPDRDGVMAFVVETPYHRPQSFNIGSCSRIQDTILLPIGAQYNFDMPRNVRICDVRFGLTGKFCSVNNSNQKAFKGTMELYNDVSASPQDKVSRIGSRSLR